MRMQAHVAPPAPAVEKAKPDKPAAVRGSSPDLPPTVGIPQAARYLGISRSTAYALAASGELPVPVLRVGHSYRVPTAPLLELLGLTGLVTDRAPLSEHDGKSEPSTGPASTVQNPGDLVPARAPQPAAEVPYLRAVRAPRHCSRGGR